MPTAYTIALLHFERAFGFVVLQEAVEMGHQRHGYTGTKVVLGIRVRHNSSALRQLQKSAVSCHYQRLVVDEAEHGHGHGQRVDELLALGAARRGEKFLEPSRQHVRRQHGIVADLVGCRDGLGFRRPHGLSA